LRGLYLTPEASENLVVPSAILSRAGGVGTDDATGSNNWALAGGLTGTGHPVLCGDPHQPFWVPSSWYEYALHGPDDAAAGAGHPGFPGMWWGCNGTTAWSITNNAASTRDLYRETVHPEDARRYRDGDGWRAFAERQVTIPVRGEPARTRVIRSTVRGPVVNELITPVTEGGDPPLSLRWVGAEHIDDLRAGIAVSRAKDFPGFRDALRDWSVAVFNFVYADRAGNIGYQMAGRVPVRRQSGGPVAGLYSVRRAAEQLQPGARLRCQRQSADCRAGLRVSDLWGIFAGPSRRAHRPGIRRQAGAGPCGKHPVSERREELPGRASVPAYPPPACRQHG
jgi:penicillin amidase